MKPQGLGSRKQREIRPGSPTATAVQFLYPLHANYSTNVLCKCLFRIIATLGNQPPPPPNLASDKRGKLKQKDWTTYMKI